MKLSANIIGYAQNPNSSGDAVCLSRQYPSIFNDGKSIGIKTGFQLLPVKPVLPYTTIQEYE